MSENKQDEVEKQVTAALQDQDTIQKRRLEMLAAGVATCVSSLAGHVNILANLLGVTPARFMLNTIHAALSAIVESHRQQPRGAVIPAEVEADVRKARRLAADLGEHLGLATSGLVIVPPIRANGQG